MDKLSFELIDRIVSYLPAGDVRALSAVCRHVRPMCLSRLDPERYFAHAFANPRLLLAAMTDLGCILSGSRALEYFVPGSTDTDSDWDFLVPCITSSVLGMMDALETCGVRWDNSLEPVFALLDSDTALGTVAHIRTVSLLRVSEEDLVRDSREPIAAPALELYRRLQKAAEEYDLHWLDSCIRVEVAAATEPGGAPAAEDEFPLGDGRSLFLTEVSVLNMIGTRQPKAPDDLHGEQAMVDYMQYRDTEIPLRMVNGTIGRPGGRGGRCKVQLFLCHFGAHTAASPMAYVLRTYYATHVQCFLSGWAAGHFYYNFAQHRLALTWPPPQADDGDQHTRRMPLSKYEKRGYQFISTESVLEIRFMVRDILLCGETRNSPHTRAEFCKALRKVENELHIRYSSAAKKVLFEYIMSLIFLRDTTRYLGTAGTLLIRFRALEDTMIRLSHRADADADTSVSSVSESGASEREAYTVARHYRLLGQALRETGHGPIDDPYPLIPLLGELRRTAVGDASAPQLRRVLAMAMPNHGNNAASISADGTLAADNPRSRYHHLILDLSPRGCTGEDCKILFGFWLPPQV